MLRPHHLPLFPHPPPLSPHPQIKPRRPPPSQAACRYLPEKGTDFGVYSFSAAEGMYRILSALHPGRRPQGGSRAPRSPARRSAPPPRSPRARGGGTRGRRSGGHRPPSRRGGRTAALLDKGRAVELPRPPTDPEGSRRRPGKPLTASPPGKGPSQPPGDTAGARRGGWARVRDGERCGGTLVEIALKYSTELQV